ncbi:MAG: pilus assembly protein [Lachnospiraceae bacterium]|nr:pilus assembly protein [Lachnospiraceae bacterium]
MCKSNAIGVFSLSCKRKRGILTVETALILPVFLMMMLMLTSISTLYYVKGRVDALVSEELKAVALSKYESDSVTVSNVEAEICDGIGERLLNSGIIKDGRSGMDFSESDLTGEEIISICVNYYVAIPFDLFGLCDIPIKSERIMHTWNGYINGLNGSSYTDYVYMTENGTVYHMSRECSHIRLKINAISGNDIKLLRNENGAKYKQCIYCKPSLSDNKLYVTSDGDKYHNTLTCGGLKRTVIKVRKSKIEGIRPCSRCGY